MNTLILFGFFVTFGLTFGYRLKRLIFIIKPMTEKNHFIYYMFYYTLQYMSLLFQQLLSFYVIATKMTLSKEFEEILDAVEDNIAEIRKIIKLEKQTKVQGIEDW